MRICFAVVVAMILVGCVDAPMQPRLSATDEPIRPVLSEVEPCGPLAESCEYEYQWWVSFSPPANLGAECSPDAAFLPGVDADADGIRDHCEYLLAEAFQPIMQYHRDEGNKGREPYFMVDRVGPDGFVHILYLQSYYFDGPLTSHVGDSEWVKIKLVARNASQWAAVYVIASAHEGAPLWGEDTEGHTADKFQWYDTHPRLFASKNHKANFENFDRCNTLFGFDSCDRSPSSQVELLGIRQDGNLGSRAHPFDLDAGLSGSPDCTRSRDGFLGLTGVECFFTQTISDRFRGWYPPGSSASSASHYLPKIVNLGF